MLREQFEDLRRRHHVAAVPRTLCIQRHLLNESQAPTVVHRVLQQRHGLIVVDSTHQHGVDLQGCESRALGSLNACKNIRETIALRELTEARSIKGVEADVDPLEPGISKRLREGGKPKRIRGQRNAWLDWQSVYAADDLD